MTLENGGCDVEDVLCQLETLRHLRGLQREVGRDVFQARFPDFSKIGDRLTREISNQEESLVEALKRCQLKSQDAVPEGEEWESEAQDGDSGEQGPD